MDLDEEAEDADALAELERAEEGSSNDDAAEEDEVSERKSLFTLTSKSGTFFDSVNYRFKVLFQLKGLFYCFTDI